MITVMVGLPASGKSTYARELAINTDAYLLSSDKIRKELYGDESIQGNPKEVFSVLFNRMTEQLGQGRDVVVDATNINRHDRLTAIKLAKDFGERIRAVVMETPIAVCVRRNDARERKVPDYVFDKMIARYEEPTLSEGFDVVIKEG